MRRTHLVLLATATVTGLLASTAGAAPKPLLSDPKGDAVALGASYDIVSANLSTKGTTKRVGRRTVYTPTSLIATVTMAGPVFTQVGTGLAFNAETTGCGNGSFKWAYNPGVRLGRSSLFVSGCGTPGTGGGKADYFPAPAVVRGNTITWTLKLKDMDKGGLIPGQTTFSSLRVFVDVNDPVFGLFGTGTYHDEDFPVAIDSATSRAVYKLR